MLTLLAKLRRRWFFVQFDRAPFTPHLELLSSPVSSSAGRLLMGAAGIHVTVGLFVLASAGLEPRVWFWIAIWFVGLRIANRGFDWASVLEKTRWERFWFGDLLSSALSAALARQAISGRGYLLPPPYAQYRLIVALCVYLWVSAMGILGGFYNVYRSDKTDRSEIRECFEQWRRRRGIPA